MSADKSKATTQSHFKVGFGDFDLVRRQEDVHDYLEGTTLETLAVTAQPKLKGHHLTRPVVPSISVGTTFEINKVDEYMQCLSEGYIYGRLGNHSTESAAHAINLLEGGAGALMFSSGMAAITTTLLGMLQAGDHAIFPDPVYAGTYTIAKNTLPKYGIEVTQVEACNVEAYRKAIKPNTKVLYGETPTNPRLQVLDLDAFVQVAKTIPGCITMVDSTFASPTLQRTLQHGVDIVLHSCTKYIGGHSDVTAGVMCSSNPDLAFNIGEFQKQMGSILSPFDAFLVLRGIRTMPLRMEKHSKNAMKIAQFLEQHPKVSHVYYPGLPSHPQHEVAKKQMKDYGGMVVFEMAGGIEASKRFVESLKLILLAVSLGCTESLIEHAATMTHGPYLMSDQERRDGGISDGLIRFSVGIEDADDLIKDLTQALEKA
ncbi:L-methionine gamma-lyase-like [Amphiura filiformis]|uniref:L-methionine gamma-lyase-like n=1 Tax=Amphiura filiformis TaxID=82378 RepID=UPI003B21DB2B